MPKFSPTEQIKQTLHEIREIWNSLEPVIQRSAATHLIPATVVNAFVLHEHGTSKKFSQEFLSKALLQVRRSLIELNGIREAEHLVFGKEQSGLGPFTASYLSIRGVAQEGMQGVAEKAVTFLAGEFKTQLEPEQPSTSNNLSEMTGVYLGQLFDSLMSNLNTHSGLLKRILAKIKEDAPEEGNIDLTNLAQTVATHLESRGNVYFNVKVKPFPPSVNFGSGEDTVRVSPTVGGSGDIPGSSVSVGVNVDINPDGEGGRPIGRLSAKVHVDRRGKPKGATIGWQCEF